MSEPFVGEIRIFGFNYAPQGWALCDGQMVQVSQNPTLFSLLGDRYGGDGRVTFGLPNLQGRVALHQGQGPGLSTRKIGQTGGTASATLSANQVPSHTHQALATSSGNDAASPANATWGAVRRGQMYATTADTTMSDKVLKPAGNGQAHNNVMPCLAVNFCIALTGMYPSRP